MSTTVERRCVRCGEDSPLVELRLHVINVYCRGCFDFDASSVPPPRRLWDEGVTIPATGSVS